MTSKPSAATTEQLASDPEIKAMMEAGVFYGGTKTTRHPKMLPFILANRGGIEIIDLEKTKQSLEKAVGFIKEQIRQGHVPILVGTQPEAEKKVHEIAADLDIPSVTTRWLGGTLTNFDVILERIERYRRLKKDLEGGRYDNYTKKEQLDIEKELEKNAYTLRGIEDLNSKPNLLIVVDPLVHEIPVNEALNSNMPIIAMANTDADPTELDYVVAGNTRSRESIEWFLGNIKSAISEGLSLRSRERAAKAAEKEDNTSEEEGNSNNK